jgi:anti-sigma regulatory factor (Ser/Thr protein kinase)
VRRSGSFAVQSMAMKRLLVVGHHDGVTRSLGRAALPEDCERESCESNVEALQILREHAIDVLITHPATPMQDSLPIVRELHRSRLGVRTILLAPEATPSEIIDALKAHVFACFTSPFDADEVAAMACRAIAEEHWRDGIEVVSGLPNWVTLRVACRLLTAERLVRFMSEYRPEVPAADRDLLMTAFREMLMNAMEHGAGFDPEKVIEVAAARTRRAIVYKFRDPGTGFDRNDLPETPPKTPDELVAFLNARRQHGKRPGGFGMLIVKQIVDEVIFNEPGNEVLLIKYLD